MDMRSLIMLIEMSQAEAKQVFFTNGVNVDNISPDELKKEYRRLLIKHHPDKGGDEETAKKINAAYDTLKSLENGKTTAPKSNSSSNSGSSTVRPNFENLDYVKWYFNEKTKDTVAQTWTVMNFDGHFFRGMFTIRGNASLFPEMANVMIKWDRFYNSRAIMVGTKAMLEKGTIAVINIDHETVNPMVTLHFDSFNLNPANDRHFQESLPKILDAIKNDTFVSQDMLDDY